MKNALAIFFLLSLGLSSCGSKNDTGTSFYYWKTNFKLTTDERSVLRDNNTTRLHIRYFDISLENKTEPVPVSVITFGDTTAEFEIIPVIYIKNEVMLLKGLDVNNLAQRTIKLVNDIDRAHNIHAHEIQIDCDWTKKSRAKYFKYLKAIKELSNAEIAVTIRLHQVKYQKDSGIPPADKGVLMYYNMGHIAADSLNSIYDQQIARRYLNRLADYPLKLNVALPVFRWGIHIRNHRVLELLNKVDATAFESDSNFVRSDFSFYDVRSTTIKMGYYFTKGDRIKIESVSSDQLKEMTDDLETAGIQTPREVIFYDLDNFNFKNYAHEKDFFSRISHSF